MSARSRAAGSSELTEGDRLGALPQRQLAELRQLLPAFHEGREVVRGELARLAREVAVAVREEQLRLADAAGIERELTRMWIARRVLRADPEVAVAPRDPVRLAAPAAMDDL